MSLSIQSVDALMQRLINNDVQVRQRSTERSASKAVSDHVEISDAAHSSASGKGSGHLLESQLIKLSYGQNGKMT